MRLCGDRSLRRGFGLCALACVVGWLGSARAAPPVGWTLAGEAPQDYETGVDKNTRFDGRPSAYLRSKTPEAQDFATLMQTVRPDQYLGKRVRLSANLRPSGVTGWAGLWMRVDCEARHACTFDNMQNRPLKGSWEWKRYEVVLDVPKDATLIAFGILLGGPGSVWINGIRLEVVDKTVPTTDLVGRHQNRTPRNLDFSE